ncbi:MAG: peptidase T [Tannerellaceae bacterium]|nr:peptidase T [Tannerellaceae bacterium]
MTVTERFLKYASFNTQSSETSLSRPSTPGQVLLGREIVKDLQAMGLKEVEQDANGYVTATLKSNTSEQRPVVGFIAHLDTSPDLSGKDVRPRILRYMGGDVVLSEKEGILLSPSFSPELNAYVGQEIIVTDGSTLLGADDKAGIAAIVSAMHYFMEHPEVKHGQVRIAFTPDEETGRGADFFDVEKFGCEWAYTVDGGGLGELEYENFHAALAKVSFKGLNVHPGTAKDKMRNAIQLSARFLSLLPERLRPEHTEGYEGFFHPTNLTGTVEEASLSFLIREHERERFERYKDYIRTLVGMFNESYPGSTTLVMEDQYHNMRERIEPKKHIVDLAARAMEAVGVQPLIRPIRGGTDGARLSFRGLPCPNLFTGGHNFHGRYEYLPVRSLEKSMHTIIKIIELI